MDSFIGSTFVGFFYGNMHKKYTPIAHILVGLYVRVRYPYMYVYSIFYVYSIVVSAEYI